MSRRGGDGGTKPMELDEAAIERYAFEGASNRDIAIRVGCDEEVIRRRCKKPCEAGRCRRRSMLRLMQWKAAEEGNPAMLIWLGKNELDQTDKQTHEHVGGVEFTLNIGQDLRPIGSNGSGRVTQN